MAEYKPSKHAEVVFRRLAKKEAIKGRIERLEGRQRKLQDQIDKMKTAAADDTNVFQSLAAAESALFLQPDATRETVETYFHEHRAEYAPRKPKDAAKKGKK